MAGLLGTQKQRENLYKVMQVYLKPQVIAEDSLLGLQTPYKDNQACEIQ